LSRWIFKEVPAQGIDIRGLLNHDFYETAQAVSDGKRKRLSSKVPW
jgi:hypothetical protein